MILPAVAASFVATWLLVGVVRKITLRVGLLDLPNSRSSHVIPTPRGGGMAILLVALSAVAVNMVLDRMPLVAALAWILGGAVVGVAGLIDDIHGLSATVRVGFHVLAAAGLLMAAGGLPPLPMPAGDMDLGYLGWVLGGLAIVWSINLYNFMDGIDGLAAAQSLFVAGAGALLVGTGSVADHVQLPLFALAGASAGFLVWNLPPAKIFMGDVGSGFIGFSLAAAAFLAGAHGSTTMWTWLALNGLFFTDATTTLLSRLVRRQRVYEAHRSHVYQRLTRRWNSHRAVTLTYSMVNLGWCLPWAIATTRSQALGPVFVTAELLPLFLCALTAGAGKPDSRGNGPASQAPT